MRVGDVGRERGARTAPHRGRCPLPDNTTGNAPSWIAARTRSDTRRMSSKPPSISLLKSLSSSTSSVLTRAPWAPGTSSIPCSSKPLGPAAHATSQAREIVPGVTEGSARFKTALARCPSGTVAYGTGAAVPSIGRIGLQMTRTSGPLDISRATGRADNNYSGSWTLTSYAIYARPAGRPPRRTGDRRG